MPKIVEISDYEPEFKDILPETYRLLMEAKLKVHPVVKKITLHGSRGPAGGYHDDSDIDLCLITSLATARLHENELAHILKGVIELTLNSSQCEVEIDIGAVFDRADCGLSCFDISKYADLQCEKESTGCAGIYKIQKGLNGFVPPINEVKTMYPCLTIWARQ